MTYLVDSKTDLDVVTLDEAKEFMKVTHSDEDATISMLIDSAVSIAEKCMNRDILTTTWINYRPSLNGRIVLRRGAFQSVESVEYLSDGSYLVIPTTDYVTTIGGSFGYICDIDCPSPIDSNCNAIKITFKTGFGDNASFVPDDIKNAILTYVAALYDGRGGCDDNVPPAFSRLVFDKYKIIDIGGSFNGCMY